MTEVTVHEAQTRLGQLIHLAARGEEVVISEAGRPLVRLVAMGDQRKRTIGLDKGRFEVPSDFNDPLPDEVLRSFEG